jgi:hypothetical protein
MSGLRHGRAATRVSDNLGRIRPSRPCSRHEESLKLGALGCLAARGRGRESQDRLGVCVRPPVRATFLLRGWCTANLPEAVLTDLLRRRRESNEPDKRSFKFPTQPNFPLEQQMCSSPDQNLFMPSS